MSIVSGKRRLGPALSTVAAIQMVSVMALAPSAMAQETKDLIIPDPTQQIAFGAYDPPGTLSNDKDASIEHLFLPWEDVELESLFLADQYALERGRSVMITIEPWTWGDDWRLTGDQLRYGILNGTYDPNIDAICTVVDAMKSPVTIRWGHEMENKFGRFTWANWRPDHYIAAYRHVVDRCRAVAPDTEFMWSPKGDANLQDYYPGDDYVDKVGLSIFGLQEYDQDKFGRNRNFEELLRPGYDLLLKYDKPIYVAELGYVGDRDYVAKWAKDATHVFEEFPELVAVVYFNDKEVWPWPEHYGYPDWRFTEQILSAGT